MDTTRYGVPTRATIESLERRHDCVIEYGDHVIMAGHYYMGGYGQPNYYAAIFDYLEDGVEHDCESDMELAWLTDIEFEDKGHALKWAISKIDREEADNE